MQLKTNRIVPLVVAVGLTAGLGYAWLNTTAADMTKAGKAFLKSLSDQERSTALMPYDARERTDWHFIPKPTRKGLQVKNMNPEQRKAAFDLLHAALSASGYHKATKIMQLETVLRELEKSRAAGGPLRDPERYFFTLFGEVNSQGRWALSVEGHHLSLNFVVAGGKVVSSTPTFFGANPGTLMAEYGPEFPKGLRVLEKEEQLAFDLLSSLTAEQRAKAIVAAKAPNDVRDAGSASPPRSAPAGLSGAEMKPEQVATLKSLVAEYANNLPADLAGERLATIERDGYQAITFCWAGGDKAGVGHDYRIQGPSFLIEFNNTQPDSAGNLANHIHSVWHNLGGNFALPADAQAAK
ncbi:MAG TPA: DUF3500 domain-containing protein [Pirellulales bacterium]